MAGNTYVSVSLMSVAFQRIGAFAYMSWLFVIESLALILLKLLLVHCLLFWSL